MNSYDQIAAHVFRVLVDYQCLGPLYEMNISSMVLSIGNSFYVVK